MKHITLLLCILLFSALPLAAGQMDQISTILLVIEEFENGKPSEPFTPFVDGVIDALWEESFIFFDMKVQTPLEMTKDVIHVKEFINTARDSGADSILLIKFSYKSEEVKAMVRIVVDKIYYHVYSLHSLKTIKTGVKEVNYNEVIEKNSKNTRIKKIAYSLMKEIF